MFKSTNQAMTFGLTASDSQLKRVLRNRDRYVRLFRNKMDRKQMKTDKILDNLFLIAAKIQFCNEAINAKKCYVI